MPIFYVRYWTGKTNYYGEPAIGASKEHDEFVEERDYETLVDRLRKQHPDLITANIRNTSDYLKSPKYRGR